MKVFTLKHHHWALRVVGRPVRNPEKSANSGLRQNFLKMTEQNKSCPDYPERGLIISGEPAPSVPAPSAQGGRAICAPSQVVDQPGDLEGRVTGDSPTVGHPGSQESKDTGGPSSSNACQFNSPKPVRQRGKKGKSKKVDSSLSDPAAETTDLTKEALPPADPRSGPGSTSDAGRAQEPEAHAGTSVERMDEGATGGGSEVEAAGDRKKRKARSRQGRPPRKMNKPSLPPSEEGSRGHLSYKDAVTDDKLVGVVVNKNNPLAQFSDDVIQTIRNDVIAKIREAVDHGDAFVPHFEQSGGIQGRLHVSCADDESLLWLKEAVAGLPQPYGEVEELGVVSPKEIPKLTRVEMWVPGPLRPDAQLLSLLQGQNKGLRVERWKRYHIREGDKGQYYVWGVDPDSLAELERLQYKPYYEMSRLTTWLGRRSKSGQATETE